MDLVRLLAALAFVLALMGLLAFALRRYGSGHGALLAPKNRRLKILEVLPLDGRRRAVLIARDRKQHLVILGPNGETVIESGIDPDPAHDQDVSKISSSA